MHFEEEIRLKRELADKEFALKEREAEARVRFFESTGPKVLQLVENIFVMVQRQPAVGVPMALEVSKRPRKQRQHRRSRTRISRL